MLDALVRKSCCTFLALLMVVGCAPGTQNPSSVPELDMARLDELPHRVGSWWSYLPEAEEEDAPAVTVEITGRTLLHGRSVEVWEVQGRGLDRKLHRFVNEEGMFLVREVRPDVTLTFQPPLRELPGTALSTGQSWSGRSVVEVVSTVERGEVAPSQRSIDYIYTVMGTRQYATAAGLMEVYEIHFAASESESAADAPIAMYEHVTWFAPHLGEVRTPQGHVLQASHLRR